MNGHHQSATETKARQSVTRQQRRHQRRQVRPEGLEATDGSSDEATHIGNGNGSGVPKKPIYRLAKLIQFLESYECDVKKIENAVGEVMTKDERIKDLEKTVRQLQSSNNEQSRELQEEKARLEEWKTNLDDQQRGLQTEQQAMQQEKEQMRKDKRVFYEKEKQRCNENIETARQQFAESLKTETTAFERSMKTKLQKANGQIEKLERELQNITVKKEESNKTLDLYIKDSKNLQSEIDRLKSKYPLQSHPTTAYQGGLEKIHGNVKRLVKSYFEELPPDDMDVDLAERRLRALDDIFNFFPLSVSEASQFLRLCGVQSVIVKEICRRIWQPFSTAALSIPSETKTTLRRISETISQDDRTKEAVWRSLTYQGLDSHSQQPDNQGLPEFKAISDTLTQIIPRKRHKEFERDLHNLLAECIRLWDMAKRDTCVIEFDMDPPALHGPGWVSEPCVEIQSSDNGIKQGKNTNISAWCLFPRVTFKPLDAETTSVAGTAVFVDSPALQEGLSELYFQEQEIAQIRRNRRQGSISKSK